ncbi:MAG: SufD family Fe-S cluster assembly protein, partial [Candidatus Saganbacteria bacterium]|nr:SufD family Fe-S cluster assembly protein [Candidatus Saganbacteria bacterium]
MPESEERLKAEKAIDKKALFGPDLDLKKFSLDAEKHPEIGAIKDLPEDYKKEASDVGVIAEEEQRSGSFFQLDHSVICARPTQEGLEVLSITDARKKYEWLKDYNWKAVAVDADKYTAQAELQETKGYFIRAKSGVKTTFPLQACLFIGKEGLAQNVHNIIIAEEGSELHIITGCTTSS